jgi:prepilin-type N-terminal cleavage/methylation domain-containing protein
VKRKNNRKGFTIVELVIVIAVIGILATVLVPTFGDVISSAKESAAKQGAKNAYTTYLVEHSGTAAEVMVYKHTNGKVVALENGVPVHVYETEAEFFAAYNIPAFTMNENTLYTTTGEAGSGNNGSGEPEEDKEPKKAVITFTFDDANTSDRTVFSMFYERGLVCNFALITNSATSAKYAEYLNYQNNGFEILSHSVTHSDMKAEGLDRNWVENEIKNSKQALVNAGLNIRSWVTPMSTLHESYLDILGSYYDSGATVYLGSWNDDSKVPYSTQDDSPLAFFRVSMESTTADRCIKAIDEAVANNGFLNFYAHGFADDKLTKAELNQILDHVSALVKEGRCYVSTISDGVDYYYNDQPVGDAAAPIRIAAAYTTNTGFYGSQAKNTASSEPFGHVYPDPSFVYTSPVFVKAGQTIVSYASFNGNVAGFIETDSEGNPLGEKELLTNDKGTAYTPDVWKYTAPRDMYVVACNRTTYLAADTWKIWIEVPDTEGPAIRGSFSTSSGFWTSAAHKKGYGIKEPGDNFDTTGSIELKAGQTIVIYAAFNSNMAGLIRVDAEGNAMPNGQLLTGTNTTYVSQVWVYTATEDMLVQTCSRNDRLAKSLWQIRIVG